ncbi:uncharacterized protein K460DRAFT_149581 [Cucurbitaria berberidis CBS 394.84]|uniref:Zn(2)-C6 fungal-type domain-containing protein n=1 Tax=Cucurbitaria berberidis CBS 394.84 TaxID=1168544 RepID=A0A9P4GDW7_9PLEO|nr:uncharacterized protein K460DRAFT_149581 [Cucurbitaria berberidis CBS 394.84]KAF1843689.1 hypothetical protein K460DRAFT_149581 [Cucurbitaria berberidis CBS 394.84]
MAALLQTSSPNLPWSESLDPILPDIECPNTQGSCWSCLAQSSPCDGALPHCRNCRKKRRTCAGYGIRLQRPGPMQGISRHDSPLEARKSKILRFVCPLGLQPLENRLLQHWVHQITRFCLAIDYTDNGYRRLIPMALEEPALFSSIMAIAAAHESKTMQTVDTLSGKYLRTAMLRLQQILSNPITATKDSTLGTMLCLVTYEIFNGSPRWRSHYAGVSSWLKMRGDCTDLNPFMKGWISMADTQSGLNMGTAIIPEVEDWLSSMDDSGSGQPIIDPILGCSSRMPKLMLEAVGLYRTSQGAGAESADVQAEIRERGKLLKAKIHAASLDIQATPLLAISGDRRGLVLGGLTPTTTSANGQDQSEFMRHMCANTEIFRYALLVYVFRVVNGLNVPLDMETQYAVEEAFRLLPQLPFINGLGSNLGWALVVIASETNAPELREYIRCRWRSLKLLGMNYNEVGELLTEEVWRRRDDMNYTCDVSWQTVMQELDLGHMLV